MAEKDLNKKKRKEPLITDEPVHSPPSKKKKNVIVWVYSISWFGKGNPTWRKFNSYSSEAGAINAIKADISTRTSWNNHFSNKTPVPFYWIGDKPPNVD